MSYNTSKQANKFSLSPPQQQVTNTEKESFSRAIKKFVDKNKKGSSQLLFNNINIISFDKQMLNNIKTC